LVTGTWTMVVVLFSALVVARLTRTMEGAAWSETWVMVVSIERVVVVVDGMEMVRRLARRVKFKGYLCNTDY
jgi:hypothetical protein